jgi:hypothetical protein
MSKTRMRLGIRLNVFAVAAALVFALPANSLAATGSVGPHYASAGCYGTPIGGYQIEVSIPSINSSVPRSTPGISTTGSQHNQVVAYKVNIFYSGDLNSPWQLSTSSAWRAAWVHDDVTTIAPPTSWYDYGTGKWEGTVHVWDMLQRGYYRAAVLYYWFADSVSEAGEDYLWAEHFDYTTTLQGVAYCTYP